MSDSAKQSKSTSKTPVEGGVDNAQTVAPDAANETEVAVPTPTLASAEDKAKANKIALRKRAPMPGRSPEAVTTGAVVPVQPVVIDTPIPVATELPVEEETIVPLTEAISDERVEATAPEIVDTVEPDFAAAPTSVVEQEEAVQAVEIAPAEVAAVEATSEPTTLAATPESGLWATLTKLRAGWGWTLALAGLAVAFYGQKQAEDAHTLGELNPPGISWICFGIAGLLLVLGVAPWTTMRTLPTSRFFSSLRAMPKGRRRLFLGLFVPALVLGIVALPLFYLLSKDNSDFPVDTGWLTNTGSWLIWLLALLLFAGAWVVWERSVPGTTDTQQAIDGDGKKAIAPAIEKEAIANRELSHTDSELSPRWHWAIIIGLFALAVAIRFPNLQNAPPGLWFDEAEEGRLGQVLLQPDAVHPVFLGGYYTMGTIYLYLLGLINKFLGMDIWQLRLLPAIGGSLTVPLLYILGTRLYNWRVGLIAGTLLAVSAWHITFSRLGMNSMPTFAIDLGVFLCVMQGMRTGRLGFYAGGGVLLGLALQTYLASQVVPLILVVLLAYRLVTERMRFFRAVRAGILVFAVTAILTFIPLGTFAVQHPETFTLRASAVNIFSPGGSEGRSDALQESIRRHLNMFNFQGDANPRHNLPGTPMLDWFTGALFFAGLASCLLRLWRWQYLFPVVWFVGAISGGVLSLLFEGPQSHRTLENSFVTALVAGIFLGGVWTSLNKAINSFSVWLRNRRKSSTTSTAKSAASGRRLNLIPHVLVAGAIAVIPIWAGMINIDRYFNKQMNDMSVWLEMGGINKLIGQSLANFGSDYTVYVSPDHIGIPASQYLAPKSAGLVWSGAYILPFTTEQNVALLFAPNDEANVLAVKRIYPNAKLDVHYGPNPDSPQFFEITIAADDIKSVRGTQKIDATHSAASLKVEQLDPVAFSWQGAGAAPKLLIDGTETAMGQSITLALGLHSVELTGTGADFANLLMTRGAGPAAPIPAAFLFDPRKVEPRGLTAYLRNGDVFEGPTPIVRVDPQVSFYFHEIPLNRPYTVEWIGKIYAPVAGTYGFSTEQLSRSRLIIDNTDVLFNSTANSVASTRIDLTVGLHDIKLQYEDLDGSSHMYLYWTPPTADPNQRYIIPAPFLLPEMGSYPTVPASGAWPTLDEADDTVWTRIGQPIGVQVQITPSTDQGQGDNPAVQPTPAPPADAIPASLALAGGSTDTLPRPRAAAVDPDGNIYIYTELDSKIKKFDKSGELVKKWDALSGTGQPTIEGSALLIRDGKLLFLDAATAEVVTYDFDGKEEARVHICDCFAPRGMALTNDGNLWVTDTGFNKVDKVTLDGKLISSVGEKGEGPGQLIEPSSVWESPDGHLFVTDAGNKRVQTFTPDGKPLAQWPMGQSTARDGNRLTGTSKGTALLTQYDSKAIIEYEPDGTEKSRFTYAPQGTALIPAGIGLAGPNRYIVLFQFDNLAGIFDIGH